MGGTAAAAAAAPYRWLAEGALPRPVCVAQTFQSAAPIALGKDSASGAALKAGQKEQGRTRLEDLLLLAFGRSFGCPATHFPFGFRSRFLGLFFHFVFGYGNFLSG